jgi:hypothetical protein
MMLSFQIMRTVLAIFEKLEQLHARPKPFSTLWPL